MPTQTLAPPVPYDIDLVRKVEEKWRETWRLQGTFRTRDPSAEDPTFYCLDMFPYPSGDGLHVGHPVGYIASDILSRYKRMKGFNVLHPMGWDAFGLPAERHAMKTGQDPAETVRKNAKTYRRQMQSIGLSYDWEREFSTTDPSFYKFTQSMFIDLFEAWFDPDAQCARHIDTLPIPDDVRANGKKAVAGYKDDHRLAYYDEALVNFCPDLGSVVANEEVMADGRTEQGYKVVRRKQRQVMMRISAFAERLLSGLEDLDWPQSIKEMQRNWIGRSVGHIVTFEADGGKGISAFTTRAETLPGVTYLALAPEHPLVETLTTNEHRSDVTEYVNAALQKSELARQQSSEKSGVATGAVARNPLTGDDVPVYVADYVLAESGTGAVMGVPAHDPRDFDFARLMSLPVVPVILPEGPENTAVSSGNKVWTGPGIAAPFDLKPYNDLDLSGQASEVFASTLCKYLVEGGIAQERVTYRIRDWIFSRQRYWGEPIPLIHWSDGTVEPATKDSLPIQLPALNDFRPSPDGTPPLSRATEWVQVNDKDGTRKGLRETLTMPQWAGSCWYALRFMQPDNTEEPVDSEIETAWGSVDMYIGGAEHATLHLLYARFWYLALSDLGRIQTREPFRKLVNQGMLLAPSYRNNRGVLIPSDEVEQRADGQFYVRKSSAHYETETADKPLEQINAKMSKSLRNVVTPDEVVEQYGADAYRVCLMFMGPVEQTREWDDQKVAAAARFIRRFWRFVTDDTHTVRGTCSPYEEDREVTCLVDSAVQQISEGVEGLRLNTPISDLMKCINGIGSRQISKNSLEKLVLAFSPFAPFMCEELWQRMGNKTSLALEGWPEVDMSRHHGPENVNLVVTINGKKLQVLDVPADADDSTLDSLAIAAAKERRSDVSAEELRAVVVRDKKTGLPKLVNVIS